MMLRTQRDAVADLELFFGIVFFRVEVMRLIALALFLADVALVVVADQDVFAPRAKRLDLFVDAVLFEFVHAVNKCASEKHNTPRG